MHEWCMGDKNFKFQFIQASNRCNIKWAISDLSCSKRDEESKFQIDFTLQIHNVMLTRHMKVYKQHNGQTLCCFIPSMIDIHFINF